MLAGHGGILFFKTTMNNENPLEALPTDIEIQTVSEGALDEAVVMGSPQPIRPRLLSSVPADLAEVLSRKGNDKSGR